MDERRRFERVEVPGSAHIQILDAGGKKLGRLKMLGRGGMLFECATSYPSGSRQTLYICDDAEGINREVHAIVRYFTSEGLGCEFEKLDIDGAVDIGVWIGRFYPSKNERRHWLRKT